MAHPLVLRHVSMFAAVLLLALSSGASPAVAATSTLVGTIDFSAVDYPGADWTIATGVNDYGDVVGTYHDLRGSHGFLLSRGVYTTLDAPGGINGISKTSTQAMGINNLGQVVGTYENSKNTTLSFLLSSGTYTSLDVCKVNVEGTGTGTGGWDHVIFEDPGAHAINSAGRKVGSYWNMDNPNHVNVQLEGFTEGPTPTMFDCTVDWPGSRETEIYGINDAGQMAGYSTFGPGPISPLNVTHGAVWSSTGQRSAFDFPGARDTMLRGISRAGRLVGFIRLPNNAAYYGMVSDHGASARIGYPHASSTFLLGINDPLLANRYNAVGAYVTSSDPQRPHGFIATINPDGVAQP